MTFPVKTKNSTTTEAFLPLVRPTLKAKVHGAWSGRDGLGVRESRHASQAPPFVSSDLHPGKALLHNLDDFLSIEGLGDDRKDSQIAVSLLEAAKAAGQNHF